MKIPLLTKNRKVKVMRKDVKRSVRKEVPKKSPGRPVLKRKE
jgi:hypothetical protein